MHKYSILRTKKAKLCIFITKYFGKRQKNGTFAVVFCPKLTLDSPKSELENGQLEYRTLTNLEYYNNNHLLI